MTKSNFYAVKSYSGETYFARIINDIDIFKLGKENNLDVIEEIKGMPEWVILQDVVILTATKTGMVPVEFSKMPMGSNRVPIQTKHITELNVLDKDSQFAKALEAIKSGVISEVSPDGIENSSRNSVLKDKVGK